MQSKTASTRVVWVLGAIAGILIGISGTLFLSSDDPHRQLEIGNGMHEIVNNVGK